VDTKRLALQHGRFTYRIESSQLLRTRRLFPTSRKLAQSLLSQGHSPSTCYASYEIGTSDSLCRMAPEADAKGHFPALAVVEKRHLLFCHWRSAGAAGRRHPPGKLGRVQKFQDRFMQGVRGHSGASVSYSCGRICAKYGGK
jgi:hypothetical protein